MDSEIYLSSTKGIATRHVERAVGDDLNAGCSPITHRRDLIYQRYSFALSQGN